MPQTIIINSANFSLLAVSQGTDASTLLLSYTQHPDATNPATLTDALNPSNYTLTGPSTSVITSVTELSSTMFQLTLDAPLATGSYTITVTNVEASGAALGYPTSLIFQAYAALPLEPINQGLSNDDNPLRRWLPPQYRYKTAWEALIAALNYADSYVRENAYNAFDQLFLSSAIRPYLFQRAADYGVQYPNQVGMSDELFRKLTIKSTAKKLVHQALLEILEVFYGEDSTRAVVMAGLNEPYSIRSGDSISFLFDDREAVTVTFNGDDFSNIAQATAGEVAAVMTRAFRAAGLAAYASAKPNDPGYAVKVYSGALGLLGSVQVTGGMAQNSLQFPTRLPLFSTFPAIPPQWDGERISQDEFRFTWTRNYIPGNIIDIEIGDYVLLDFVNASVLRGSYEVTDVTFNVDPTTGNPNGLMWFSIAPTPVFPYVVGDPAVTINQTSVDEIIFYRKVRQTVVQGINPSYIAQYADGGVDVIYPATTQAVDRGLVDAAYPHLNDGSGISGSGSGDGGIGWGVGAGGGIADYGIGSVSGSVGIPDISVELASAPVTVLSTGGGAFTFNNVAAGDHVVTPLTQPTVTISPLSFSMVAGATQQMAATLHTATGTSNVTTTGAWGSGNTGVFTVNSTTGLVTGVGAGTADVTYAYNGTWVEANISVTVYEAPVTGVNFTRALIYATPAVATVTAAPVKTLIPLDNVNSVAHVGVNAGAITAYTGPTWTPGAGGSPDLSPAIEVFPFYPAGLTKAGMTNFSTTKYLSIAANNAIDTLFQGTDWVLTMVIKLPSAGWGDPTPCPFSLGDVFSTTEPGFVLYGDNQPIPNGSWGTYAKHARGSFSAASGDPVDARYSYSSGGLWLLSNLNIAIISVCRTSDGFVNLAAMTTGLSFDTNPVPDTSITAGTITHDTFLGKYWNSQTGMKHFANGIIYEMRMWHSPTPITSANVSTVLNQINTDTRFAAP